MRLESSSAAEDAALRAVADLHASATATGGAFVLVGGQMVNLLARHYEVTSGPPARMTRDADLGAEPSCVASEHLISTLTALGYEKTASNRFERSTGDAVAVIDVLGPSSDDRLHSGVHYGNLTVDAIPGLQLALAAPPVLADIDAVLTDGTTLRTPVRLPNVDAALVLKTLAWPTRWETKDVIDVWRLLEVAAAVGLTHHGFRTTSGARRDAARILRRDFYPLGGAGIRRLNHLGGAGTRVRLLVDALLGPPKTTQ